MTLEGFEKLLADVTPGEWRQDGFILPNQRPGRKVLLRTIYQAWDMIAVFDSRGQPQVVFPAALLLPFF